MSSRAASSSPAQIAACSGVSPLPARLIGVTCPAWAQPGRPDRCIRKSCRFTPGYCFSNTTTLLVAWPWALVPLVVTVIVLPSLETTR